MKVLLDTNVCVHVIRERPPEVLRRFEEYTVGDIAVSSITVAELYFGARKSGRADRNEEALEQFLLPLEVVEFGHAAAIAYGRVRAALEELGTPIGPLDTLIAAHARDLNLTLVTNNIREFSRVPDLELDNWVET
ncbi:MAG: type II toxin-antitoxin system VapC family toxin [Rubrobacteraceae bacterium]|nr:type II toxin-antitoxin system VapC family toxin [Rubrobacter sp.]